MNNNIFKKNYSCSNNKNSGCSCLTCNLSAGKDSQGITTGAGTFPGETNNPRIQELQGAVNNNMLLYNIKNNMTDKRSYESSLYDNLTKETNLENTITKKYDVVIKDDDNGSQYMNFQNDLYQTSIPYNPLTSQTQVHPADTTINNIYNENKRNQNAYTCVFPEINNKKMGAYCYKGNYSKENLEEHLKRGLEEGSACYIGNGDPNVAKFYEKLGFKICFADIKYKKHEKKIENNIEEDVLQKIEKEVKKRKKKKDSIKEEEVKETFEEQNYDDRSSMMCFNSKYPYYQDVQYMPGQYCFSTSDVQNNIKNKNFCYIKKTVPQSLVNFYEKLGIEPCYTPNVPDTIKDCPQGYYQCVNKNSDKYKKCVLNEKYHQECLGNNPQPIHVPRIPRPILYPSKPSKSVTKVPININLSCNNNNSGGGCGLVDEYGYGGGYSNMYKGCFKQNCSCGQSPCKCMSNPLRTWYNDSGFDSNNVYRRRIRWNANKKLK